MLYHASPIGGLTELRPHISNHGIPLLYFSQKRENTFVYLSNAVESTAGKLALHTTVHGKSGDPTALPMMAGSGWRNTTQTHWKKPIEAFPVTSIR